MPLCPEVDVFVADEELFMALRMFVRLTLRIPV